MRKGFILLFILASIMGAQEAKWHPNDLLSSSSEEQKTALNKDAGKWFVGIEGGYDRLWGNYGLFGDSIGYNTINYGIKFGYILEDNNRIYLNYNRNTDMKEEIGSAKATVTLQKLMLGVESISPAAANFGIVYGGAIGWARGETEWSDTIDSGKEKESAFAVGIKIGGIYEINDNNEVEFGAKAGGNFFSETIWNAGAYIGYNFKF